MSELLTDFYLDVRWNEKIKNKLVAINVRTRKEYAQLIKYYVKVNKQCSDTIMPVNYSTFDLYNGNLCIEWIIEKEYDTFSYSGLSYYLAKNWVIVSYEEWKNYINNIT